MSGSVYGKVFSISTWGESHGKAIGVTVDGCPAGLLLSQEDIQLFLNRRRPGQSSFSTTRTESDSVEILSGIFEGKTTGTPISMLIRNESQRPNDYNEIASFYRPGHADYTYDEKFGFRDYKGGGRSSGRETIGRVAAGAIASKLLSTLGISVTAYTRSIHNIEINYNNFSLEEIKNNLLYMPDADAAKRAGELIEVKKKELDSLGGVVECVVKGMPVGVGEPVFDKLDASLAKAIVSIGAVKGFEVGDGFMASKALGSTNNDHFGINDNGDVIKKTNHSGGILGGLSDGSDIVIRAAFKPTPSIASPQETITNTKEPITVRVKGRHDPVVVPRAVVVVESMTAITILDLLLQSMTSNLENIKVFFKKER